MARKWVEMFQTGIGDGHPLPTYLAFKESTSGSFFIYTLQAMVKRFILPKYVCENVYENVSMCVQCTVHTIHVYVRNIFIYLCNGDVLYALSRRRSIS